MPDPLQIVGKTLQDRYRVDASIGEGGYGYVYKAFHIHLEKPIALKFLKLSGRETARDRERYIHAFDEEAKILLELSSQHKAFVRVLDLGRCKVDDERVDTPFIVMEWLEGLTLENDLERRQKKGEPARKLHEVMECLGPIAEALSVAHGQEQRIAHRDIKPANIFLAETDEGPLAKLLDFGIAKVMNATGEGAYNATTVGAIAGFTPMYAAPEQWKKSFGATGPWTDVYALALVCVEMMTGKTALSGDDALQLMAATVDPRNRPTPRGRGVMVSSRVEAVFRKALAIEAKDRYANAQEFWGDLQKAGSAGAGTGRRALELGAGVFGVLIAAGTFWGLMRWQDRKPVEIPRDAGVVLVNLVDAGAELDGGVEQAESPGTAGSLKLESSAAPVPKPSVVAAAKVIGANAVEGKDGGVELDAGEAVEEVDDGTDPYDPEPVKEFDQNAANAATQSAANAVGVGCARAGGPSGAGTVKLIFEPTGEVSSVTLLDAVFEGTEVGACILRRFGAIRVPPFGGASKVGTKGFWIKEVEGVPAPPPEPAPAPGGE